MKNRHIIAVGLMALFGLASCNKYLDHLPDSRLEVDTPDAVALLLSTAYSLNGPMMLLETASDNMTDNGVNIDVYYEQSAESYMYKDHSTSGYDTPHHIWETYYKAITTANIALAAIEKLETEGHDMSAHKAEALITRAWNHFILVNVFCMAYHPTESATDPGIPYMTEPVNEVFASFKRGTVKEVWDKIDEDIEAALPHIDDNLYEVPKNHFNRKAAYCFAAEFNLYYGNFDKAIEYANIVLGGNPASIMRNMAALKAQTSSNNVRHEYIRPDLPCNLMICALNSRWGRIHTSGSRGRFQHNRAVSYAGVWYSPGPWSGRTTNSIGEITAFGSTSLGNNKSYVSGDLMYYYPKMPEIFVYTSEDAGDTHVVWIPFTVEKALLTRAEALVWKERYDEATEDLLLWYNTHHTSSVELSVEDIVDFYRGVAITTTNEDGDENVAYHGAQVGNTKFELNPAFPIKGGSHEWWGQTPTNEVQDDMIQAVLHARRIEFLHEGWRLIDLKRFGIPFTHKVDYGTDINIENRDKRLAVQLPFMVLSAGMEPNPR